MATKILIYSNDPALLSTRRLILEQAGAQVFATTDFEQEIWFIASHEPNLLILCESLQMDQRWTAMMIVRDLRPEMKVLVMMDEDTSSDLELEPFNGDFLNALDGPDALLTVVDRMLSDCCRSSQ
jgi:DNA-binding response OmpR family regulator